MNIVFEVFRELNYDAVDEFIVKHSLDEKNIMQINVKVLISKQNNSQVFLIVNCSNDKLKNYNGGGLIKEIALQFRKKEYHRAEMDRNTSFLIISEHEVGEEVDISSKVKIEDDPYYFKKYVFTYDEVGLENAAAWIKGNDSKDSLITLILGYITDTEKFARYKKNGSIIFFVGLPPRNVLICYATLDRMGKQCCSFITDGEELKNNLLFLRQAT